MRIYNFIYFIFLIYLIFWPLVRYVSHIYSPRLYGLPFIFYLHFIPLIFHRDIVFFSNSIVDCYCNNLCSSSLNFFWLLCCLLISLCCTISASCLITALFFFSSTIYYYQPISLHSHAHKINHETPWTAALQASLSMDFSRQEYWSGMPAPSPGFSWLFTFFHRSYIFMYHYGMPVFQTCFPSCSKFISEACSSSESLEQYSLLLLFCSIFAPSCSLFSSLSCFNRQDKVCEFPLAPFTVHFCATWNPLTVQQMTG